MYGDDDHIWGLIAVIGAYAGLGLIAFLIFGVLVAVIIRGTSVRRAARDAGRHGIGYAIARGFRRVLRGGRRRNADPDDEL